MTKYKVVKATPFHMFKEGEVLTKAPSGSPQETMFRELATVLGMTKDPRYAQAAAYINSEGTVQVLQDDEVVEIDVTLH